MSKTIFGQVVIGPPGSGKTTYCAGMLDFLHSLKRKVAVVNLDPANDCLPYQAAIDISSLITVSDVMDNLDLGPNGSLLYCMDYLLTNIEWLLTKLNNFKDHFLLFDFPGQVELYTHHASVKDLLSRLERFGVRACAVYLVDSHYCSDAGKFISVLMTSLTTMLHVGMPHVNVLSKIDIAERYGKLQLPLDFYTEVLDLDRLLELLDEHPFTRKYNKLNRALTELIENYSLVSFIPLNINDKKSLMNVRDHTDKACGYVFGVGELRSIDSLFSCSTQASFHYEKIGRYHESLDEQPTEEPQDAPFSKI